jgi:class 3 adenylate cyclase
MIAPAGQAGRFVAEGEQDVATRIREYLDARDVGFAFGSLACGADILFAEAMIKRGGKFHVVLPFRTEEFIDISVRKGGEQWVERFRTCLAAAASVHFATEDSYLGDDGLFGYCSQLAMGLALLRARYLGAPVEQVALWDGQITGGVAGTSADTELWHGLGHDRTIIDSPARLPDFPASPAPAITQQNGREPKAMLFGDFKDFSKLTDSQLRVFVTDIMGTVAAVLDRSEHEVRFQNSWGDGLYLVFDDALAAARCALDLQAELSALSLSGLDLPENLSLRLGGHFGPVYLGADPVMKKPNYFGTHVSRTARIEPETPEGCVYVSEPFAAALALDPKREFTGDYVGTIPLAKKYGDLPIYLLRRHGE